MKKKWLYEMICTLETEQEAAEIAKFSQELQQTMKQLGGRKPDLEQVRLLPLTLLKREDGTQLWNSEEERDREVSAMKGRRKILEVLEQIEEGDYQKVYEMLCGVIEGKEDREV